MSALGDENIRRLDIAVDDAFGVGCFEGVSDFDAPIEHLLERKRLALDAMLQRRYRPKTP